MDRVILQNERTPAQEWSAALDATCNRLQTQYLSLLRAAAGQGDHHDQQQQQGGELRREPKAGGPAAGAGAREPGGDAGPVRAVPHVGGAGVDGGELHAALRGALRGPDGAGLPPGDAHRRDGHQLLPVRGLDGLRGAGLVGEGAARLLPVGEMRNEKLCY